MTQSKRYEITPKRLTFVQQHYTIMDGKDDISNVIREKKAAATGSPHPEPDAAAVTGAAADNPVPAGSAVRPRLADAEILRGFT